MKTIYTIIVLFALFVSGCQKTKQVESNPKIAITSPLHHQNNKIDSLELTKVGKLLEGIWLPSDYVLEIEKTKSPHLASKLIPDISEIQIDPSNLHGDSLIIGSSLGNHEGYGFKIWIKQENGQVHLQSDVREWENGKSISEFKYTINADTTISLVKRDKAGNVLQTIDYIRIRGGNHITQFGGLGYNYLARKVVMNGSYFVLDSVNNNVGNIKFDAESGQVSGFKFKNYDLQTDFANGPEFKTDLIFLNPEYANQRKADSFILKAKNDTVRLWTILKGTRDDSNLEIKELKYTFIKKQKLSPTTAKKH